MKTHIHCVCHELSRGWFHSWGNWSSHWSSHLVHWRLLCLVGAHHWWPHRWPHHRRPWWPSTKLAWWRGGTRRPHSHHAMWRAQWKGRSRVTVAELRWHKSWSRGWWRGRPSHPFRFWRWRRWRCKHWAERNTMWLGRSRVDGDY